MKRIFPIEGVTFAKRVLALVSCTVALASLTLVPAAAQAPTDEQLRALAARVVDLVNQERANAGLPPYTVSPQLSEAARRHSQDMADHNFYGYTGSDGSTFTTRIQDTGYQGSRWGEYHSAGHSSAEETMNEWMNGQFSRETILRSDYQDIGVAVVYNANTQYGYYWTMDAGGGLPPTEAQLRALEARVLDLVNQERAKLGISPYTVSSQLSDAARRHSLDMATHNFANHTGSDGSSFATRIQDTGYQGFLWGENINFGVATAEEAMNGWMSSPGHRANILGVFVDMGVAVAFSANSNYGGYYWTMDFGR
jgi:uncharacterized protein YkwD